MPHSHHVATGSDKIILADLAWATALKSEWRYRAMIRQHRNSERGFEPDFSFDSVAPFEFALSS
jgi:hypothetical protein